MAGPSSQQQPFKPRGPGAPRYEAQERSSEDGSASYHSDSSFDPEDDHDLGDWISDEEEQQASGAALKIQGNESLGYASTSQSYSSRKVRYLALFPNAHGQLDCFKTAQEALDDASGRGCDVVEVVARLQLDPLQIIRLLNHLRRAVLEPNLGQAGALSPRSVAELTGKEAWLDDDAELMPVKGAESDGLLQTDFDELMEQRDGPQDAAHPTRALQARIQELETLLQSSQLSFEDLRQRYMSVLSLDTPAGHLSDKGKSRSDQATRTSDASREVLKRDDDSHYFTSYAGHDIHQTMISDVVRTLSYAKFLLHPRNASLIRGKTVMDVGCGSGILSLLAARAGAKEVIAIDASDVAERAEANVRQNGFATTIRVVKGKVEELKDELKAYEGSVDLLVSEWMGYFLLYESMLPSVLYARDMYLRSGGVLAPSHSRMTLAALSDKKLITSRMDFWNDVHGFEMHSMRHGLEDEAWTEHVSSESIVSSVATIQDLPLEHIPSKQPTFVAPFSLIMSSSTTVHGFISWFDTWFSPNHLPLPSKGRQEMPGGEKLAGLPPCETRTPELADVRGMNLRGGAIVDAASDEDGGEVVSFTTGPAGRETHWKQTLFILKEPIQASKGDVIEGTIHVSTSAGNSRELDVELHYITSPPTGAKAVRTETVQLFAVR
ncbi:Protein arginine N-methyltransferase PRMT1 and related enzymes [Ceraceosorus bombacis]|uniref:type I protein arginine methyltransferase n=1 Tax=Ceraceosorus bombacis TaxID=401625 RepID=A0A0P1BEW5_9BASI|nr:Protein arginine N-methyltransferase PRMT1 and related enzymes [Ceraceosorus bombacis]